MICRYRVAYLNCRNLHLPDHPRAEPGLTVEQLKHRLIDIKETLLDACARETPDILCLCEIGDERLGIWLAKQCGMGDPVGPWAEPRPIADGPANTGLQILVESRNLEANLRYRDMYPHGQPRWMAAAVSSRRYDLSPVMFCLNHWHAPDYDGTYSDRQRWARREITRQIARTIAEAQSPDLSMPALLLGDLNVEPFDEYLRTNDPAFYADSGLLALRDRDRLQTAVVGSDVCLYNPMWRFLGEDAPCDWQRAALAAPMRPPGTHPPKTPDLPTSSWRTIDQVLVTPDLLGAGTWRFPESTLRVVRPIANCSDHCAIGFCIEHVV